MKNLNRSIFYNICIRLNIKRKLYIAYSGGVDSSVLLKLIYNSSLNEKHLICAIHIDHSVNEKSSFWSKFCKSQCNSFKIPIKIIKIKNKKYNNLEESLRIERYKIFIYFLKKNSTLFLAHHNNDIAETALLKLFRGSGIVGLSNMKKKSKFGKLDVMRPLLEFDKESIIKFSIEEKVRFVQDNSNKNNKFDRNFVRNEILPVAKVKWCNINSSIYKYSKICNSIYRFVYKIILNNIFLNINIYNKKIPIKNILSLPKYIRYEIIRIWLKKNNIKSPSFIHYKEIDKIILAKNDIMPMINLKKIKISRFKNNLYLIDNSNISYPVSYILNINKIVNLNKFKIFLLYSKTINIYLNYYLNFKNHGRKIKKIFQKNIIPFWEKNKYPIIKEKNNLAIILGLLIFHKDLEIIKFL
ncbi:MAG: tRNA lysidine(34) synthetase TilS [Enterobacteriaceae bacterium]|nr:tRNA lysidine(34) synthetase TilS [Enterobacteriaceae bacterium]